MNKQYRIVWSESSQSWVAVAEIARAQGKSKGACTAVAGQALQAVLKPVAMALALWSGLAYAAPPAPTQLPTGGQVVGGQASIAQTGAAALTVNQTSNAAVIHWDTFNLGSAASVNFVQPSSSAAVLNRVLDANPSQIYGRISAPGQVFFTNPSGMYFGPTSSVDVGGFTATTHSIGTADFMAGHYRFTREGATGAIVNEGQIQAALGGYVALLAPEVRNHGVVLAQMGSVTLAAGETYQLQIQGSRLASIDTTPATIATLVENGQAVLAPGGWIVLAAKAAAQLEASVVNTGQVAANSLVERGGRIVLESTGSVTQAGSTTASSEQGPGGQITISAPDIALTGRSRTEAKGATGGGTVLVGGDWQGSGNLPQATTVTMAAGASIDASATQQGDGGKVVLWSDIHKADSMTTVHGSITARGGAQGGHGGQVETSGHAVDISGASVNAGADKGQGGLWLLDPYDYTIGASEAATIKNSLDMGTSFTLDTANASAGGISGTSSSNGDITISSAIGKTAGSAATLTLNAARNISIGASISSTSNALSLNMTAGGNISGSGALTLAGGTATFNQATAGTYSGVIGGTSTQLVKAGAGTLTLSANNTYTGTTNIQAGTLQAGNGGSAGSVGTGAVTVASGATLAFNRSDDFTSSVSINGAGSITKLGSNTLSFTNDFGTSGTYFSGTLNINAGQLTLVAPSSSYNSFIGSAININNGSTLALTSAGSGNYRYDFRTNVNFDAGGGGAIRLLRKEVNWVSWGGNTITTNGGLQNRIYSDAADSYGINLSGLAFNTAVGSQTTTGDLRVEVPLVNGGTITKSGAGTVVLANGDGNAAFSATPYTTTTINAGSFIVGDGGTSGRLGSGTVTVASGANLVFNRSNALSVSNTITGAGNVQQLGTGSSTLSGTNTYTGSTTVSGGTLKAGSSSAFGSNSAVTLDNVAGATLDLNGFDASIGSLAGGGLSGGNVILGAKKLTVGGNNTSTTYAGVISGSDGSLTKTGTGTLTLTSNSTYTGATLVSGGILELGNGGTTGFLRDSSSLQVGNAGLVVNQSGTYYWTQGVSQAGGTSGTFDVAGTGTMIFTGGNIATTGTFTIRSGATLQLGEGGTAGAFNSTNVVLNGNIVYYVSDNRIISKTYSGSGNFSTIGTGIITLYGGSTYSGTTTIATGATLRLGDEGLTRSNGTTGPGTTGSIGTGAIVNNGTLIFRRSNALSMSNTISGTGAVIQQGSGTTTLTANGSYTGATTISAGTLVLQNDAPTTASSIFSGPGKLVIEPSGSSFTSGFSTSGWAIDAVTQLTGLTIGKAGNTAAITLANATTVNGPVSLLGGDLTLNGALTATSSTITLASSGNVTHSASAWLSASNLLLSGGNVTLTNSNNAIDTLAATGVGGLSYVNSKAVTIGTVGSTSGLSATGVVSVSTRIGDLSVTQAVSTSSTSATALTLNAGSQIDAGVFSGGNLTFSGSGAASVGSGGIARLYTGSVAGSTGLTGLTGLGSGSGRFRYGSDESTTNYSLALTAGLNAIYREQPSITRVVDNQTITYGDALPSFTFSISGGGNGDSYSQAFGSASAPTVSVGGSTSTSGRYTAGEHGLSASGGATTSQLGYAVNASTTSGTLLVNRKTLTPSFTGQDKTYDGTNSATVSVSDNRLSGDVLSISRSATFTAGADAGTGKAIGVTDVLLSGADAANYSLAATTGSATANITPAALTVRANDDAKFVTLSDANGYAGVTYTGFVNGETALALGGTLAISRSNSSTNTAGSYSGVLVLSGLSSNNYSISYVRGDYTIVPANQLVVKVSNASTVYGTAASYSVTSAQYLGADNQVVTLSNVTVGANNQVTIQDGASASASFTLAPLSAQWSTAQKLRVGSYQLGTSGTVTENSQNFSNTITVVGSHTVTAKGLNATVTGTSKTYDGSAAMTGMTLGLSTVEALDAVTVSGSGAYVSKDVGTRNYTVSNVALSGADAGNYYLATGNSLTGSGTIAAKQLTLSASKTYDGTTSLTGVVTLGGLIGSETLSYTGATASNAHVATSGKYINAITLADGSNGGLAANYVLPTLNAANAPVTITAKALVTSASIVGTTSKTYDGTTTASGASVSGSVVGAVAGDTLTLDTTGITLAYNNAHVADASSIGASGSLALSISSPTHSSQASDYSYSLPTIASVAARITPAVLSASLSNTGVTKVYDGSTSAPAGFVPSWSVSGFVTGDSAASLTPSTTAYNSKNVSQATLLTLSGLSITGVTGTRSSVPSDYVLSSSSASVSASITTKTLTITGFQAADKTYDGTTYATVTDWGRVVTGVGSETLALNHGTAVFNNANAGTRTVTATNYTLVNGSNGGLASNYALSSTSASASTTIHKALLTITANDDAKFITTSDVAGYAGVSYSGFVNGETSAQLSALPSVTRDLTVRNTDNNANVQSAGIYQNALKASGASATNYDFSYVSGNYTIVPADQLLVRLNPASTTYGSTPTYSLASARYAYYDNTNTLQVVELSDTSINASNLVTVNDGAGGRATFTLAPRSPSVSTGQLLRVGSYQLGTSGTVTENSANFSDTITLVGAVSVTPKALLVSTNSGVSKTYDGTTTMNGVTFSLTGQGGTTGVAADDLVTVSGNGAYNHKNAGTNLVYTVNNVTLSGADAGNYYITSGRSFSGGNGTITPKALTLSAVSDTKFFDGSTRSSRTPDAVGLASGDSFSSLSQAFNSNAVGLRRLLVSYTIDDGNDGNNYTVTLNQANGTIQAQDAPQPPAHTPPGGSGWPPAGRGGPGEGGPGEGGRGGSGGENGGGTPGRNGPEGAREGGGAAARLGQPINTQLPTEPPGAHSSNVRVILVHDAGPRAQGLTRVYVPRDVLGAQTGFSFLVALPPTDEAATASLRDGSALPAWLAFDGRALRFTASRVPSNGLPLLVRVQRGPLVMEVDLFESMHP